MLATLEDLLQRDKAIKKEYSDRFPVDIPHTETLPDDVLFRIKLKDADKTVHSRSYDCPQKYHVTWKILLNQHIAAGRLWLSSSSHASPVFIIPKADPTVLLHWINDYRQLNSNTVPDNHPLPRIDEILQDCAKGKIFGKMDMTNSFFQTHVHTSGLCSPHSQSNTLRPIRVDRHAHGCPKCPHLSSTPYDSCATPPHWEMLPHLPRWHHHLVANNWRTWNKCMPSTGCTSCRNTLLLSQEDVPLLMGGRLPWMTDLCPRYWTRLQKNRKNRSMAKTTICKWNPFLSWPLSYPWFYLVNSGPPGHLRTSAPPNSKLGKSPLVSSVLSPLVPLHSFL